MSKRVLLAVDLSNQIYRAAASHSRLTSGDTFTGGLYGVMVSVASAISRVGATDLVFCMDSKPYVRSLAYPQYKAFRKKDQDPELRRLYKETEPLVLEWAGRTGIPVWAVPGFESDDLIGHAVRLNGWRYAQIVAMSNDEDLFQLCDHPRFKIWRDVKRGLLGAEYLRSEFNLSPADYVKALALSGTHNDVEGIAGIGPKKSAAIVNDPAKWRRALNEHGPMIERNLSLIRLPHADLTKNGPVILPSVERDYFSIRDLYRFAGVYEIDITPMIANAFEQVLL